MEEKEVYVCKKCDKEILGLDKYTWHVTYGKKCGKNYLNEDKSNMFTCEKCNLILNSRARLEAHLLYSKSCGTKYNPNEDKQIYICEKCQKDFKSINGWIFHSEYGKKCGEKDNYLSCPYCFNIFRGQESLSKHIDNKVCLSKDGKA